MKNKDIKLLKELSSEVKEALNFLDNGNYFNMALMYGLIFGLLGGLFATIIYNELLKDLSPIRQLFWYIIIAIILAFFLIIGLKEFKRIKKKKKELIHYFDVLEKEIHKRKNFK